MNEELREMLKKMQDSLANIQNRNEVSFTTNDLDTVCNKLDEIIELLKKER